MPEHWIIDAANESILVYLLDKDNIYEPQKPKVPGDTLKSTLFNDLRIEVSEIFTSLPGEENLT